MKQCLQPEHGGENLQHLIIGLVPHGGTKIDHTALYGIVAVEQRRGEKINVSRCRHAHLSQV